MDDDKCLRCTRPYCIGIGCEMEELIKELEEEGVFDNQDFEELSSYENL